MGVSPYPTFSQGLPSWPPHLCVPPNARFSRLGCSYLRLSLASRLFSRPKCALVTLPSSSTPRRLTSRSCHYLTAPLSFQSPAPVKYLLNGWRADFQLLLWHITTNSLLNTTQMYSSTVLQVRSLKSAKCIETKASMGLVSSGGRGFPVLSGF